MRAIHFAHEPKLHIHKYVVTIGRTARDGAWVTKLHYCMSLKEVNAVKRNARRGHVVEVFNAAHTFRAAFENVL